MILTKRKSTAPSSFFITQLYKLFILLVLVLMGTYAFNRIKSSNYFPIKTVQVYGVNRADHAEVQALLTPLVDHGFFTINVDYIHDRLAQMPWVASAYVRKSWPDRISIKVIEKNPIAKWNDHSLISDVGELFAPNLNTYPADLPTFIGPEGSQVAMLQYYASMNRIVADLHAKILSLELTPYLTWKVVLDNGIILQIGHKDILTRLSHFVKVYPQIVGARAKDVEYIDLRYANGVAIRWKETVKT